MKAEAIIDLTKVFNGISYRRQAECVSEFYSLLSDKQRQEFFAQIIEDADDDTLINELECRGYDVKEDD